MFALLSIFGIIFWYPLHCIAATNPVRALQKEGNTVVLGEVDHLLVRSVEIRGEASWPGTESPHEMDVIMFNSACHSLPKDTRSHPRSGNKDNFQNISFYLMPSSQIQYRICASSNYSNTDLIYVYIIPGLQQDHHFQPDKDDDDVIQYTVKVATNGKPSCRSINHSIGHWNFYTIRTFIPNKELVQWAEYNMTVEQVYINKSQLSNTLPNHTLDSNKANVSFPIHIGRHIKSCVIADIRNVTVRKLHKYIHTELNYTLAYKRVLGITVFVTVLFSVVIVVSCVTLFHLKRKHFHKTPWRSIFICRFKQTSRTILGRYYSRLSES